MTDCQTHRKKDPFVRISRDLVMDERLSWKAKGIMMYVLSRVGINNWTFYKSEMMKHSTDGRDSFTSGIKELEKYGYVYKEHAQNPETGQFEGCIWHFYEDPGENPYFKEKITENMVSSRSDNQFDGEPTLNKKDLCSKKENNNDSVDVVFSDETKNLLDQLPFNEKFKRKIHTMKDASGNCVAESLIRHAATVALRSKYTNLEGFFTSVIQDPERYKLPPDPRETENNNKQEAERVVALIESKPQGIVVEILNQHIEIHNGVHQPTCVSYSDPAFLKKLYDALQKWNITLKKGF